MFRTPRPARGTWAVRSRARRAFQPALKPLEARTLLSTAAYAPTDFEQAMLALVNRARANPAAEGRRLVALAQSDPALKAATQGWDLNKFLQVISSYPAEPPLAFNTRLIEAARDHDAAMLAVNAQVHAPSGYLTNPQIAVADDGQTYYPTGNNSWATGENIFAYSGAVSSNNVLDAVNYFEAGFLLDWGNPDFGHLTNLLAPGPGQWTASSSHYPYTEIGIGLLTNVTPTVPPGSSTPPGANLGINVGPDLVTQEFGWRSGNPILTGVFYADNAATGLYLPGEGSGGVTIRAVGTAGQGVFQTQTWSSGGYSLPLPGGTYTVTASGGNLPYPTTKTVTLGVDNVEWDWGFRAVAADLPVPGNFSGSAGASLAVYRPAAGVWFVAGQAQPVAFGGGNGVDQALTANFDGVGHAEMALYRPSTAQWFVYGPSGGRLLGAFGQANVDLPVPGDYLGLGRSQPAVYRPTTAQWFVNSPSGGKLLGTFGGVGLDLPVPGDYDGVGRAEQAVYRPSTGQWFVNGPSGGRLLATFGQADLDIPIPGDYDGVGHLEPAVYRPTTGQWFILGPNGVRIFSLGEPNLDVPLRVDFNGDGKLDPTVYRPTTGQWFTRLSGGGSATYQFGQGGSIAAPISTWLTGFGLNPSPTAAQPLLTPVAASLSTGQVSIPRPNPVPTNHPATLPRPGHPPRRVASTTTTFSHKPEGPRRFL